MTTSSYLLDCLASRPEGPCGLDADYPWLEWIGGMVAGQNLFIRSYENNVGRIAGPPATLSELMDDFWCRHLLREVPLIVERVQKLEDLKTENDPSEVVQTYFEQAMRCFAFGLNEASAALMRACLEQALRDTLPYSAGVEELEALVRWAGHLRRLDHAEMQMADRIRRLGNNVLHKSTCSSDEVYEAVVMLRALVAALYVRAEEPGVSPGPDE